MASQECCPHVDASRRRPSDLAEYYKNLNLPGRQPTPEDDPTPLEKLQPWIDMLRELFLESQLRPDVVSKLMNVYVPKKHRHAIKPIIEVASPPENEKPPVFHPFPSLPAELRITIWELAAAEPPRVLRWGDDRYWRGGPPLNAPKHMPLVAQACKEAWDVVHVMGGYWECTWAAARDLVFIPAGLTCELRHFPRARGLDFLCARREVAVNYRDFVALGATRRVYRFLVEAKKLDTLVCVMAEPQVNVCVGDVTNLPAEHLRRKEVLRKLVMYEDLDELERLDALWRGIGPESRWLWRGAGDLFRVNGAVYAPKMVSRCMGCEMRRWEDECVPRIRSAWLRMVWAEDPDMVRSDPGSFDAIFPDGFMPDEAHPWVRREVARMPRLKPAALLGFVRRQVADDAGCLADWRRFEYLLEHPESRWRR